MAFDDPVVWVLVVTVIIFLFGSNKIPQLARSLGQARKEFENGWKGITNEIMASPVPNAPQSQASSAVAQRSLSPTDPLVIACKNEGIDTAGKTREQLSTELAWKLNKK